MEHNKAFRYLIFSLLYFAQGAILSYFTALNSLYLLSFDLNMTQIGLMGTIAIIPFIIKIFIGILSDKVNLFGKGHRKPYIIIGLTIQAISLLIVSTINPGMHFWLYAITAFILMTGMALYDTCTDGLALDTTRPNEEGTIQGFMVGGRALGIVIISALIGLIVEHSEWNIAFYVLAFLSMIPLPFIVFIKEPDRPKEHQFNWKAFNKFSNRSIIALGILGALYSLIINAANQIVNPFLQQQFQISISTAGFITTVWGIGVVVGGLTGGNLTDRIGHKNAIIWAVGISMISIATLSLINIQQLIWGMVFIFGIAFGYYETVYFAISMNYSDPRIAASMFSILMAIANIGTGIGFSLSGQLVDLLSYRPTFIIIALLNFLALPLLPIIFNNQSQNQDHSKLK